MSIPFNITNLLVIYSVLINIITYYTFALDKKKAQTKQWRIPESRLLLFSLLGGSGGGLLGMILLRHKTKKSKFVIFMPMLFIINIITWLLLTK